MGSRYLHLRGEYIKGEFSSNPARGRIYTRGTQAEGGDGDGKGGGGRGEMGAASAWNRYRRPFINPWNQYAGINESAARTAS